MEPVIKERMVQFLVDSGHNNERQHAFAKNHLTVSNMP